MVVAESVEAVVVVRLPVEVVEVEVVLVVVEVVLVKEVVLDVVEVVSDVGGKAEKNMLTTPEPPPGSGGSVTTTSFFASLPPVESMLAVTEILHEKVPVEEVVPSHAYWFAKLCVAQLKT